jgi:hypothetical protein
MELVGSVISRDEKLPALRIAAPTQYLRELVEISVVPMPTRRSVRVSTMGSGIRVTESRDEVMSARAKRA